MDEINLKGIKHKFIQDKPKVDNCHKCSLQNICYERFDKFVCAIFFDEEVKNGHFEIKE